MTDVIAETPPTEFDLEETIEAIARAASSFDIFKLLKATGIAFNLPRFLVTTQPCATTRKFAQRVVITNWDAELLARFIDGDTFERSMIAERLRNSTLPNTISIAELADYENPDMLDELHMLVERGYDRVAYFPFQIACHTVGAISFTGIREPLREIDLAQLAHVVRHASLRLNDVEAADIPDNPLTNREIGVFELIAEGLTAEAIGRELDITSHTVNYHITNVVNKLGVRNRSQALVTMLQNGWLAGVRK